MASSPDSKAAKAFKAAYDVMVATWPVAPEEKWLTTKTGKTHLLAAGPLDAPAVFLVPGIATPGVMWTEQISALVGTHRVYAVDLPGNLGFSEPVKRPRTFEDFARWFAEVLDALGLERADYVGMSYGGLVGAHLALLVPERLRRLVLMAPAATLHGLAGGFMMRAMTMLFWPSRARYASLTHWMAVAPKEAAAKERYLHLVEGMIDLFYLGRKRDGVTMLPNPRVLTDDELKSIKTPTLVVMGDQERIYPGAAALARAEALIPGVKTVTIPEASHDLMFAQPARVNAALSAFLA